MSGQPWSMRVSHGLFAHFNVRDGPSREGSMWSVNLTRGDEHYVAMVKGLPADVATKSKRKDAACQTQTAMEYLNDQLRSGWHPSDAVEHTIHISNPLDTSAAMQPAATKPWWQFW